MGVAHLFTVCFILGWIKKKYFRVIDGRDWVFSVKTKDMKGRENLLCLASMSKIEILRHIKVKDKASPDYLPSPINLRLGTYELLLKNNANRRKS